MGVFTYMTLLAVMLISLLTDTITCLYAEDIYEILGASNDFMSQDKGITFYTGSERRKIMATLLGKLMNQIAIVGKEAAA